jgi:small-conductance mechanosensitive channel
MDNPAQIHTLLLDLFEGLNQPSMLRQAAILLFGLSSAWALNNFIRKRMPEAEGAWKLGIGGVTRVAFPLVALLVILAGRALLKQWHSGPVSLLNVAVPLLGSLALIRLAVYLLRHAFPPSAWISASERLIAGVVWLGLALHLTGFLPGIIEALDDFGFHLGKQRISLLMVLAGLFSVAITLLVALWLGKSLESRVMRVEHIDMNLRVVLAKLIRALLLLLGVLVALPAVGIDLTVLSVFGGALGVGIGLGLQKIASNYVSGFIILLDRSIHLGDVLTVDNRYGSVSRLTGRYMVLKSMDGTEAIIPNETLVSTTVLNHSYSNREMRVALGVQVDYKTDVEHAMSLLADVARRHPRVLPEPPPKAYLKNFADSGIDLELGFWIDDPEEGQLNLKSDINLAIWQAFRRENIQIPYPQREVRILGENG